MSLSYDPETCITAGEMRCLGFEVPENIPDAAWCRRSSLHMVLDNVAQGENNTVVMNFMIHLSEPLQWVELDFVVSLP